MVGAARTGQRVRRVGIVGGNLRPDTSVERLGPDEPFCAAGGQGVAAILERS